jgi:AcrR family transcriptional regulator
MKTIKGIRRKKDPEGVKISLLESAIEICAELGIQGVTTEAVCLKAGVTKGSLFHHFKDKNALLVGMFEKLLTELDLSVEKLVEENPNDYGCFTRAYINAGFTKDKYKKRLWSAIFGALNSDLNVNDMWNTWIKLKLKKYSYTDSSLELEIIRLAADGLWMAYISEMKLNHDLKKILDQLLESTRRKS